MHQGLLDLEKRGTDKDKLAVAALRKIEEILGTAGIKPKLEIFERHSFEHFTDNQILDLEFCWFYDLTAQAVVCSLEFRDNSELEIVYSIYIRLDLPSDRWYLGYKHHESRYDSRARKIALKVFRFTRAPAEFEIPEQRILSEVLQNMIKVFNDWSNVP